MGAAVNKDIFDTGVRKEFKGVFYERRVRER